MTEKPSDGATGAGAGSTGAAAGSTGAAAGSTDAAAGSTGATATGAGVAGASVAASVRAAMVTLPGRRGAGAGAFVLAIVTVGALAHVALRIKGLEVAYALGRERRIGAELEEQRRQLQLEIGVLKDPGRMVTLARDKLKMAPPAPEAIRSVTALRWSPPPAPSTSSFSPSSSSSSSSSLRRRPRSNAAPPSSPPAEDPPR